MNRGYRWNGRTACLLLLGLAACSSTLDVGQDDRDGGPGGPGPLGAKRMFVTRTAYAGNLATLGGGTASPQSDPGADGADKLCSAAAAAANLGGTWRAWLSSCTIDPNGCIELHHAIDRIADVAGGWYNVDRTMRLFSNKANLATLPLASHWSQQVEDPKSFLKDEYGGAIPTDTKDITEVWTGTAVGGRIAQDTCKGWTEQKTDDTKGTIGAMTPDPAQWTNVSIEECRRLAHLYCLEQ